MAALSNTFIHKMLQSLDGRPSGEQHTWDYGVTAPRLGAARINFDDPFSGTLSINILSPTLARIAVHYMRTSDSWMQWKNLKPGSDEEKETNTLLNKYF